MDRFLELIRELAQVSREADSPDASVPQSGIVEEVNFYFGPPRNGLIAFYIIRNGKKHLIGNLCDCYPVFPIMRGWMERSVTPTFIGRRRLESITIECEDGLIEMSISPTDLEPSLAISEGGTYYVVGILRIRHILRSSPHVCFCNVEKTMCNLYHALLASFRKHAKWYDDKRNWVLYDTDISKRRGKSTAQLLREQLRSEKIELLDRSSHIGKPSD